MADKGFNIQAECMKHNISLCVPPGKRDSYQMVRKKIEKIKRTCSKLTYTGRTSYKANKNIHNFITRVFHPFVKFS